MELRDLRCFLAIVETGSFTKAAEQVFVSQPSLSKSVKRLEQELQVSLLERSTRFVRITDAGHILYEQGKRALQVLEEVPVRLEDLKQVQQGSIKIGIPPLIGTLFFPELAREYHDKYPNIQLELTELGAKLIWQLVENGEVHIGFVVLPTNEELFTIQPFIEDEFMLYVHELHPLAQKQSVSIRELRDEKFIVFSDDFTLHDVVIQECNRAGFIPNIVYKSSQWDLILELVSSQLGITLLPRSIFDKHTNPQMKIIPLEEHLLWRVGIITKKDAYIPFAVKQFLQMAKM